MLTISDLKMTLGGRVLFEHASMQVNPGDRVALVGPNGAGKSTIFSIILKEKEPDSGRVERDPWTMVGYLPQEGEAIGDETVLDVATGRVEELPGLDKRLHELEKAGEVSSADHRGSRTGPPDRCVRRREAERIGDRSLSRSGPTDVDSASDIRLDRSAADGR